MSLTAQGNIRYRLNTPYRDVTTDVVFEPLDKIAPGDLVKTDIEICEHCGGAVKVIASIEDPAVIKTILEHLARQAEAATLGFRPFARAPPQQKSPGLKELG